MRCLGLLTSFLLTVNDGHLGFASFVSTIYTEYNAKPHFKYLKHPKPARAHVASILIRDITYHEKLTPNHT